MNARRKASATPGPGFLGSTSSSADYIGAQRQYGFHDVADDDDPAGAAITDAFPIYPQHQINAGAAVLAHFLEFPFFESFFTDFHQCCIGVSLISPWITAVSDSIRTDLYEPLLQSAERPGDASLQHDRLQEHLSRKLFRNTSDTLEYDGHYALEHFAALFTGQNLRWEAVGIFFVRVGLGAVRSDIRHVSHSSGVGGLTSRQRAVLARRMLEGGQMCLSFCERTGHMVDPEIWLSFELAHLASVVEGDSSHKTWRQLGDAISTCFAMGLHIEKGVSDQVLFWLSELRKRSSSDSKPPSEFHHLADAHFQDVRQNIQSRQNGFISPRSPATALPKILFHAAAFRPGRQLPQSSHDQLEATVNMLDAGGWSRSFSIHGSVFVRAILICDMFRDDILELSLTTLPQNDDAIAQDIRRRSQDAWQSLPSWLRILPSSTHGVEWGAISHISLDFLYNDFLLERTMVRKFHRSSLQLCRMARELLQFTLSIIANKEEVVGDSHHISWTITQYGLPAAGVLALELLQQSQAGARSPNHLPRSEVVQNLSRLIAYIKPLVPKEDANYVLCDQARRVIQRILDQILSSPFMVSTTGPSFEGEAANISEDSWLLGAQSESDFWASLPEHPLLASPRH